KSFLARHLGDHVLLMDVAREAGTSVFGFARIFREHAGMPLHRYLTLLRLRAALERLCDASGNDLTVLALELGFSSHSHFTEVFRREFGSTPSRVRRTATSAGIKRMSKNLIV